ncbi:hypothetical protein PN36_11410 [Candidatus Thiomargarita nelsonii]|uniref:LicD/FKTN/FKRP nucleotidyltransferase domain-containing protein n=1 Tax=Candidatus Thiomargarita nelsonii TaxID=1003181 RepID=A0A4E0RSZ2_9GAMM|nr:hypothetical protein PN36_11410 [Candidatus Thiomargarita nelsonii]
MDFDFPYTDEEKAILRKWQVCQLACLSKTHTFMQAEGLNYWIDCGTLLGAIRHKAFVPWDDDIDLCLLEADFLTLRQKAKQIPELGKNFGISIHLSSHDPYYIGIGLSGLPRNSIDIYCVQRFRFGRMSVILKKINRKLYFLARHFEFDGTFPDGDKQGKKRFFPSLEGLRAIFKKKHSWRGRAQIGLLPFAPLLRLIVPLMGLSVRLLLKYLQTPDGKFVSYHLNSRFCFETSVQASTVFPLSLLEFEGQLFYAPSNPHQYLVALYGDYKTPPPLSNRVISHYTLEEIRQFLNELKL